MTHRGAFVSEPDIVFCHTVRDHLVPIPRSALEFRPIVCGIAIRGDQVLSWPNRLSGRWELSGSVEPGARSPGALRREFHQEAGLLVLPDELSHFEERFFHWLGQDVLPWHVLISHYRAKVVSLLRRPARRTQQRAAVNGHQ
jgi:8-oxo-dGTP pyrophosphatase MutT (NUDIX family)